MSEVKVYGHHQNENYVSRADYDALKSEYATNAQEHIRVVELYNELKAERDRLLLVAAEYQCEITTLTTQLRLAKEALSKIEGEMITWSELKAVARQALTPATKEK
jgi:hypothetical protein